MSLGHRKDCRCISCQYARRTEAKDTKRKVYIELVGDSWQVRYVERPYRGRYLAACFYAPDTTKERVAVWVKNNPRLKLVENAVRWRPIATAPTKERKPIWLKGPWKEPQAAYSDTFWISGFSDECKPTHWKPRTDPKAVAAPKSLNKQRNRNAND